MDAGGKQQVTAEPLLEFLLHIFQGVLAADFIGLVVEGLKGLKEGTLQTYHPESKAVFLVLIIVEIQVSLRERLEGLRGAIEQLVVVDFLELQTLGFVDVIGIEKADGVVLEDLLLLVVNHVSSLDVVHDDALIHQLLVGANETKEKKGEFFGSEVVPDFLSILDFHEEVFPQKGKEDVDHDSVAAELGLDFERVVQNGGNVFVMDLLEVVDLVQEEERCGSVVQNHFLGENGRAVLFVHPDLDVPEDWVHFVAQEGVLGFERRSSLFKLIAFAHYNN